VRWKYAVSIPPLYPEVSVGIFPGECKNIKNEHEDIS
jgi:hypothetical protein